MRSIRRERIDRRSLVAVAAAMLCFVASAQQTTSPMPGAASPAEAAQAAPATPATPAAPKANALAFARAARLSRGVNLSNWYSQTPDYSAAHLATYIDAADFKLIRSLGFDSVRLPINPEPLLATAPVTPPPPIVDGDAPLSRTATVALRPEAMARLDATVREITDAGLVVVLDIQPEEMWMRQAFTDEGAPGFLYFWRTFARHYAATDPEKVYFEVLNEPHNISDGRWAILQERAVAVIRKEAPAHTIIVTGAEGGLTSLIPLADPNVIYTFHEYNPVTFTHQGAPWMGEGLSSLREVPYPSTAENIAAALDATKDEAGKDMIQHYGIDHWNRIRMQQTIEPFVDWGRQFQVPVWCGEFGAIRDFTPTDDRARWISDTRQTLEAGHIGWAMWDYRESFGFVRKEAGVTTVDESVMQALGLKAAGPAGK
jgi:aryl-phospho-beta-D-glucosidase BglC (GH1 family)